MLGCDASDAFTEDAIASISLLIFLLHRYVVTAVMGMHFMFCLMCANVMFSIWVIYL